MNKTLISLVILVLVVGGGWYWWSNQPNATPGISITSPLGGETWQAGETHVISWNTQNVSPDNKISITIRRIPPPPLQEEGQEFDPIILIDLPNNGSTTWKISSMYPEGTYVIGAHAYASIPITDEVATESASFTLTHPKLLTDLSPLYSGVTWKATEVESFLIGTTTYKGASVTSWPVFDTTNPSEIFTPFEKYYDKKLKALGWTVANNLAAGGHVGGQTGYQKDGKTILTRFQINYKTRPENAPSECPCDVTLSLFSSD